MIVTDVYVSFDDITYRKLDLFKNEPITIQQTAKDLDDITKVFLPYSLSFSVQASDVNKDILDWFGYSKSLKRVSEYKFFCKIYTNYSLAFKGILKVNTAQFENNIANQFNVSFATTTTDLKALINEDTLQDLGSLPINYSPKNIQELLVSGNNATVNDVNVSYFVPFVSNNRVWSYDTDTNSDVLDNIAYKSTLSATDERLIKLNELKPAIYIKSLFDLIIKKYNIDIICPFFATPEFATINMWCNENIEGESTPKLLVQTSQYANTSIAEVNFSDSSTKLKRSTPASVRYVLQFINVELLDGVGDYTIYIRRKSDNQNVIVSSGTMGSGSQTLTTNIPYNLFIGGEFEFYTYIEFKGNVYYVNNNASVIYIATPSTTNTSYSGNNTLISSGFNTIDIFKMLPKMKVIDFITSFTKSFNISIINNNPKKTELFWLRKEDIDTEGLTYSKNTIDYTPYWIDSKIVKSIPTEYNRYNFKHATSAYFSNVAYKKQFNKEYGQVVYPEIETESDKEMKIETEFSIIPPVYVQGLPLITAYGFTDESPETINSGASRYKPNTGEPTLFHRLTSTPISFNIGVQSQNTSGNLINKSVTQVNRVAPFSSSNFSLAFSNIIFDGYEFVESLFFRHYAKEISRLTNPRVKLCNFNLKLPSSEMDINEYTKVNATSLTPTGFRIQNDIIIEETKYTIIDSQIDISTGNTKIQLLNY